jgi:hypothetical protein
VIDTKCKDFLDGYADWSELEYQLKADVSKFEAAFGKHDFSSNPAKPGRKVFQMKKIKFINKYGVVQEEEDWLKFEYEIGWMLHSNEPKCFAGDHLTNKEKSCDFWCAEDQCTLKNPKNPNNDNNNRRLLQKASSPPFAGRDISKADYDPIDLRTVPLQSGLQPLSAKKALRIPTQKLSKTNEKVVPDRLLQIYLNKYTDVSGSGSRRRSSLISVDVSEEKLEEAQPIKLNA